MSLKCPSCGNQVTLSETIKKELDRRDLEIKKLKSYLWDRHVAFRAYKKFNEDTTKVLARERQLDREENQALRKQLAQAKVTNRKGTPGYRSWLTKFQAARTATA